MADTKESMTQYEALRSLKGLDDEETQPKMASARKALKESSSPKEERKALARKGRLGASNQAGFARLVDLKGVEDEGLKESEGENEFDSTKVGFGGIEAEGDAKDGYSVTVTEENSGMPFVIDVWIKGDDVQCDWNQYIFDKHDEGDMKRRTIQSDADVFEAATSAAIHYLEAKGLIAQGEDGKWSYGGGKKEECAKPGSLKESEGGPDMRLDVDEGEISKMPKAIDLRGVAKISPVEGSAGQFDVWATGKCVTPGYVQDKLRAKGVKSASVIAYSSKKGLKESDEGES